MTDFSLADVRSRHKMSRADQAILKRPEAKPIIARLSAATDADYPHRVDHVHRIAVFVIKAKRNPMNKFATATWPLS